MNIEYVNARLAAYKDKNQDQQGKYWELSDEIFKRLHDENRGDFIDFLVAIATNFSNSPD